LIFAFPSKHGITGRDCDGTAADLLRSRLDAIIEMNYALVKLFADDRLVVFEERFGAVDEEDGPGRPPLPRPSTSTPTAPLR
jgi:hypothetical protein